MTHNQEDRDAIIEQRRQQLAGGGRKGGTGRLIGGAVFMAVLGIAAFALLATEEFERLLGLGTSVSEEMQRTTSEVPDIMTEFTEPDPAEDTGISFPEAMAAPLPEQQEE